MTKKALQALVDKWKSAAAYNYEQAATEPDDAEYRHGYAAAADTAATDLLALLNASNTRR